MASQSVGKYLDRTKLKLKLRAKYGANLNFNVQAGRAGTSWSYPDGEEELTEDEIEQCQKN